MIRKYSVIVFCLIGVQSVQAQFASTVRTIRPTGRTMGAYTVGRGVFQIQSGLTYNAADLGGLGVTNERWNHNTVLRFGILENLEVNGVFGWRTERWIDDPTLGQVSGVYNTQLGARYNLIDGSNGLAMSVQARVLLILQSEIYQRNNTGYTLLIGVGHPVGKKLVLNASGGGVWKGSANDDFFLPLSLRAMLKLRPLFGAVAEYSTLLATANNDTRLGLGFYYFANKNLKLDFYLDPFQRNVTSVKLGLTWRIHNRD